MSAPVDLLQSWLAERLNAEQLSWLETAIAGAAEGNKKQLFLNFSMAPRKSSRDDLLLTQTQLEQAAAARPGWDPVAWTVDQAVRTLLVMSYAADEKSYVATLDDLFAAGEVGELVALYQALPLLPHSDAHMLRAAEGVRTNMKSVFCAVAHHNPYPSEQFDEGRWNQMVLKCLFVGVLLDPVVGLDERSNPKLARMLSDYAHERWAASRTISPELWRPVGPFATGDLVDDLARVLGSDDPREQQAAALALSASPDEAAKTLLAEKAPELQEQVTSGALTWKLVGRLVAEAA